MPTASPTACDLILANPPYIVDAKGRAYRDGGDLHGGRVSLEWAKAAIPKLAPGGRMLLYTGAAILRRRSQPASATALGSSGGGARVARWRAASSTPTCSARSWRTPPTAMSSASPSSAPPSPGRVRHRRKIDAAVMHGLNSVQIAEDSRWPTVRSPT